MEELLSGQNTYCTLCTNLYEKGFLEIHVLLLCVFCSVHYIHRATRHSSATLT